MEAVFDRRRLGRCTVLEQGFSYCNWDLEIQNMHVIAV